VAERSYDSVQVMPQIITDLIESNFIHDQIIFYEGIILSIDVFNM